MKLNVQAERFQIQKKENKGCQLKVCTFAT